MPGTKSATIQSTIDNNLVRPTDRRRTPRSTAAKTAIAARLTTEQTTELVAKTRAGCFEAETALFQSHRPLLLAIAHKYGLNEQDCADVVQRAWLKAREALPSLRSDDRFRQWIAAIARNEALRTIRFTNRETSCATDELEGQVAWDPDAELIRNEALGAMRHAVQQLESTDKTLLRLLFVEGKSYRQTADELGCATGCIGPNRGRMLKRLRNLMQDVEQLAPVAV